MAENSLALTLTNEVMEDRPIEIYTSAVHALGSYLHACEAIGGMPAVDYERLAMVVQCSNHGEPVYLERISQKRALEAVFERAKERAGDKRWACWVRHRVHQKQNHEFSRQYVNRVVKEVDGIIEEELDEDELLIPSQVNPFTDFEYTTRRAWQREADAELNQQTKPRKAKSKTRSRKSVRGKSVA